MKSITLAWAIPLSIVLALGVLWAGLTAVSWVATAGGDKPGDEEAIERPDIATSGPMPQVTIDEAEFDFGAMEVGQELKHTFAIRNTGKGRLVLKKGDTSCKCTISELTDGEVAPGDSANIELSWRPISVSKKFRQVAKVFTNDPKQSEIELVIVGKVTRLVEVEPSSWQLPLITTDDPIDVETRIYSKLLDEFQILDVACDHDSIVGVATPLDTKQLQRLGAKSGYLIKVRVDPQDLDLQFREKIVVQTDINDQAVFTLFVDGEREGPIRIIASGASYRSASRFINFGSFPASKGAKVVLSLFVKRFDEEGFQVAEIVYNEKVLKVNLVEDPQLRSKRRQRFELTIEVPAGRPPTSQVGEDRMEIVLKTNHPVVPELRFQLEFRSF